MAKTTSLKQEGKQVTVEMHHRLRTPFIVAGVGLATGALLLGAIMGFRVSGGDGWPFVAMGVVGLGLLVASALLRAPDTMAQLSRAHEEWVVQCLRPSAERLATYGDQVSPESIFSFRWNVANGAAPVFKLQTSVNYLCPTEKAVLVLQVPAIQSWATKGCDASSPVFVSGDDQYSVTSISYDQLSVIEVTRDENEDYGMNAQGAWVREAVVSASLTIRADGFSAVIRHSDEKSLYACARMVNGLRTRA